MTTANVYARIRLRLAIALARDIQEYRHGDTIRFARMVDGRNKQICTPPEFVRTIGNILNDKQVLAAYPVTCRMLATWLQKEMVR